MTILPGQVIAHINEGVAITYTPEDEILKREKIRKHELDEP